MKEQADSSHPTAPKRDGLTIPWSGLSTTLGVITLTAVGTLAVVTTVKEVDTLSTIALALAVLSFAAQLIVTLIQAQQASRLSAETQAALTEVRATTSSLLTNQRDQFNTVLKAALQLAIPAAVDDVQQASDSDTSEDAEDRESRAVELETAIKSRLDEALTQFGRELLTKPPSQIVVRRSTPLKTRIADQDEWNDRLATFPEREEGQPVAEILKALPPRSIAALGRLTGQADRSSLPNRAVRYRKRPGKSSGAIDSLADAGLVKVIPLEVETDGTERITAELTPKGITAARILRATGDRPDWVEGL